MSGATSWVTAWCRNCRASFGVPSDLAPGLCFCDKTCAINHLRAPDREVFPETKVFLRFFLCPRCGWSRAVDWSKGLAASDFMDGREPMSMGTCDRCRRELSELLEDQNP